MRVRRSRTYCTRRYFRQLLVTLMMIRKLSRGLSVDDPVSDSRRIVLDVLSWFTRAPCNTSRASRQRVTGGSATRQRGGVL